MKTQKKKSKPKNNQPKQTTSGLMISVSKIQKIRSRSEASMSDGGGSGRSDSNDNSSK